jgi:hypothetical protein
LNSRLPTLASWFHREIKLHGRWTPFPLEQPFNHTAVALAHRAPENL